jgi:hypothetical protein
MTTATVMTIEEDSHRHLEILLQLIGLTGSNEPPGSPTTRCPGKCRSTSLQVTSAGPNGSSLWDEETTEGDLVDGNATQ